MAREETGRDLWSGKRQGGTCELREERVSGEESLGCGRSNLCTGGRMNLWVRGSRSLGTEGKEAGVQEVTVTLPSNDNVSNSAI